MAGQINFESFDYLLILDKLLHFQQLGIHKVRVTLRIPGEEMRLIFHGLATEARASITYSGSTDIAEFNVVQTTVTVQCKDPETFWFTENSNNKQRHKELSENMIGGISETSTTKGGTDRATVDGEVSMEFDTAKLVMALSAGKDVPCNSSALTILIPYDTMLWSYPLTEAKDEGSVSLSWILCILNANLEPDL